MSLAFETTVVGRSVLLTLTADVLSVIAWYFLEAALLHFLLRH